MYSCLSAAQKHLSVNYLHVKRIPYAQPGKARIQKERRTTISDMYWYTRVFNTGCGRNVVTFRLKKVNLHLYGTQYVQPFLKSEELLTKVGVCEG